MKKLLLGAVALTLLIGMNACKTGEETPPEGITINTETLSFTGAGGSETVTVTGPDWETSCDESWIIIEEFEGSFKVTVEATVDAREGVISVTNPVETKTVTVNQAAAPTGIEVDSETLTFDGQGGKQTVTVTSDIAEWTATAAADSDWLTVTPNANGLTFDVTVGVHAEDGTRTGSITVSNGKEDVTVTVAQEEIPWYELTTYKASIFNTQYETLSIVQLNLYGADVDAFNNPVEDCWNVKIAVAIEKPADLTGRTLDIPAGTYLWQPADAGVDDVPFISNDGTSNYTYPPGATTYGERLVATDGKIVVAGEGAARTTKITYYLEDGSVLRAMYTGSTTFNNPLVSGLLEDLDLGTAAMSGWLQCDAGALKWGANYKSALWHYHFGTAGVTFNEETNAAEGTGYYIALRTTVASPSDGVAGSMVKDGTYNIIASPSPFGQNNASDGVMIGKSSGSTDNGAWIYRLENGEVMERAPLVSGTVGISYADPNHTFVIDAMDSEGNHITGTLSGELTIDKMTI